MIVPPELILEAYRHAVFPMADDNGRIEFYTADPRAIIPLDDFHVPRRLARTIRQGVFEARFDADFDAVISGCAAREQTWISRELSRAYRTLHEWGWAHSVECYREGALAGGLYGVAIGGFFAGESMFSRERDASKVALVHLVMRLRERGFRLLDSQFAAGNHLRQFGLIEVPLEAYRRRLANALAVQASFP